MTKHQRAAKEAALTRAYNRKRAADDELVQSMGGWVRDRRIIGADDPRYSDPAYIADRLANPRGRAA